MRDGEIRALGEIAGRAVARPSVLARDVHGAVTDRVFGLLGPLGMPARIVHDTVSNLSYRGVGAALRGPLQAGGRAFSRAAAPGSRSLADSPLSALGVGAANGVFGDRLARDRPDLSLDLTIRDHGGAVVLDAGGIAAAFPRATAEAGCVRPRPLRDGRAWGWRFPGVEPAPAMGPGCGTGSITPLFTSGTTPGSTCPTTAAGWHRLSSSWSRAGPSRSRRSRCSAA